MPLPAVSVVLPVYNCPRYVGEAIESILAQSFADFELIMIDDGSTDETPSVLRRYSDPRIRLVRQENRGLAATLNRGIELAKGRYIARQDQDDISYPERFAKQAAYLDRHPSCALVGTWADIWRENASTGRQHRHASDNATLQYELLLNNPFVHSSVMIRKAALDAVGSYTTDAKRQPPEDFELWSRLARRHEVANIPEVLHVYREVSGSMSRDGVAPFLDRLVTLSAENIASAAGLDLSDPQATNIAALAHGANHRVREPDFDTMRKLFIRAAVQSSGQQDAHRIERLATAMIEGLKYRARLNQERSALSRLITRVGFRINRLIRRRQRTQSS
jgi:glycosyltransferase involved in cell wall biosynthesis